MINRFFTLLRENFLLRWTLANAAGWTLALGGVALGAWLGGGFPPLALLLAGGLAGACVGYFQGAALQNALLPVERGWLLLCAAGGAMGALPALLLAFTLLFGWGVGGAVIGAAFAGVFGLVQTRRLRAGAGVWVAANVIGGLLCGALSTSAPVVGPVAFGLVTGWALGRANSGDAALRDFTSQIKE